MIIITFGCYFVLGLDPLHDPRAGTAHPSLPEAGHEPVDRREEEQQFLSYKIIYNYRILERFHAFNDV